MPLDQTFGTRFRKWRESQKDELQRRMSQQEAAALFCVSLSTIRGWERFRCYPDERGRLKILEICPIVFEVTSM